MLPISIKKNSFKETEKKFKLPIRKISYLVRKDIIKPIVEDGKIFVPEEEIKRYLSLPKNQRTEHHKSFLKSLGPGLITGAADDDTSGIIMYSSVGAKYNLQLTWLAIYLLPMMSAVQETCARIGIVTGKGLADSISKRYGRRILFPLVFLLFMANTINIGADIGGMAASLKLLAPINFYLAAILFTVVMLLLEIFFSYQSYAKFLKWLTFSLFAYILTGIIIHPNWLEVGKSLAFPHIQPSAAFIAAMVGVMGTTISPYLFFWQTSEEVEEERANHTLSEHHVLAVQEEIKEMRKDTYTGMSLANLVFMFVVITTAFVLFRNGVTDIQSAEQAAMALKPLAGDWAYLLFTIGMVGTGLLAVPVLAGASAYAIAEMFKWNEGLYRKYTRARGFYAVIIFSMILGLLMNFIGINPIKGLYYAAVFNGITAPVLMYFIFKIGRDKSIMGRFTSPRWVNVVGTAATILMGGAAIFLLVLMALGVK